MAMKPIVGMAAAQAAKQKLALQPNGTFAPAGKPNMPMIGPIGGKSMPPPNTGGMIATPPPGMGGGMPPLGMGDSQQAAKAYADYNAQRNLGNAPAMGGMKPPVGIGTPPPPMGSTSIPMNGMRFKKGGSVKASKMGSVKQSKPSMGSASKRGDGIAQRGKTKGRIV